MMNLRDSKSETDMGPAAGWALVVDDHPLFCDALALTLRSVGRFDRVETDDSLEKALSRIEAEGAPDLILLDLNLPDVSGLDGLIRLKRAVESTPVAIVSSITDDSIIRGAIISGAAGFVPKHSQRAVFQEALQKIGDGEIYTPSGFVADEVDDATEALARLVSLTNQQARILELICEGKLNKQIAFDLSIAETTVKAHVTAIMRKLGVQSRTQAVLVAQNAKFSNILPSSS
jgi:DNA-binding NarL/FixJ family response regulator